ncbi:ester cyclase [Chitinophagaceae bacterium LB-8]|uniref:Ester cyclase n=1 Tax=Paraflavisolibacter caeni TaxID=2982496 RepID=A0A9X3BJZ4_9BACT|nr:ester cyclase [Paraflavisolibacter caeni]MCU7551873.1 ester cyclase [Paraflavisolibacter caeni]
MKKISIKLYVAFFGLVTITAIGCANNKSDTNQVTKSEDTAGNTTGANDQVIETRLRRFDSLDFQFYSNQQWDSLAISHDANIKVYYPDGTTTTGLIPQHIDMLKPLFSFAPDTKITSHPIKFGSGDWTCVVGEIEGTFSKPMTGPNSKTIQPTGKKFKLSMCTVGHWKNDKMIEEYLFWDNQAMMKQIGLAQ